VSSAATKGGEALSQRRIWLAFAGLVLAIFMATLDQSIVNPALPTIVGDLHGLQEMQWVVTGYLLASTIVLPLYGKLGDLLGRKYLFLFAIAVFLLGSMLTGLSQNMTELIGFRALQGVGAGGLFIGAMAISADLVSPRQRAKYLGIIMAVNTISTVAGPLVGGLFTDTISWRWCFYVNVPIGIGALLVAWLTLESPRARPQFRLDLLGSVLIAAAAACLVFLTSWGGTKYDWGSWQIIGLGAGFAVAAVSFVLAERRASEPVVPLRLFKDRTFTLAGLVALAAGFCMFGTIAFLPTFLQIVDGVSATQSGLLMLPLIGGLLVSSIGSGRLVSATGHYKVFMVAGTAIGAVGMALLSFMGADSTWVWNGLAMAVTGFGMGLVLPLLTTAVQNAAPRHDLGTATSTNTFFRQIGGSLGTAVVGTIFTTRLTSALASDLPRGVSLPVPNINAITPALVHGLPPALRDVFVHAYATALPPIFLYLAPVLVAAFVVTWFLKDIPLRSGPAPVEVPEERAPAAQEAKPAA
jgi:EmrB/QacA subfamily drug resistance transporter